MQSCAAKHWMHRPLQPGQMNCGGGCVTTHCPDAAQRPGTSMSWSPKQTLYSAWQLMFGTAKHVPALHWPVGQAPLPVTQALPLVGTWRQPTTGSQLSVVQALPSSQLSRPVVTHAPLLQESPVVQALPSSQDRTDVGYWHPPPVQAAPAAE
jgi:hypothetical protein